ncbi:F-box domain-containing protein [Artemisia annua]|uniref:F-box domain-containing protein n=1 Tax=Artemisia annua TaxID=35608 RepID=A0A2U1L6Q9_ARTAN|nr:F-box domain-containing protein [Artemisia annua]
MANAPDDSHLGHSINTKKEILLEFDDGFYFDYEDHPCTAHYSRPPNHEVSNFLQLPVKRPPWGNCFLIGSVNGLICFITEEGSIHCPTWGVHIWNPSLSAFLSLPSYSIGSICEDEYLRFGFDPKADDYKVVKVIIFEGYQILEIIMSGKWRDEVSVWWHDGHVHWIGYDYMTKELRIVAFDLHEKTFCLIPVPDCEKVDGCERRWWNYLGMWNGKLCLISHIGHSKYEMWLMNEYKVAESWVKCYIFNKFLSRTKSPFRFTVNKEYLLEVYRNRLSLYDPVAKSFKYMLRLTRTDSRIVPYVDSLVWVAPSKSGSPAATTADSNLKRKINVVDGES